MLNCYTKKDQNLVKIKPLTIDCLEKWLQSESPEIRQWVASCYFSARPCEYCMIPDAKGDIKTVLIGIAHLNDFWPIGMLPKILPKNNYVIDHTFFDAEQYERLLMAWGLGSYQFNRYLMQPKPTRPIVAQLYIPEFVTVEKLENLVSSIYLVRDMINTPADDMGPADIAEAAEKVASENKADIKIIKDTALLNKGYPTIYAVGRACEKPPHLIDLHWGDKNAPKITLVGKGVCFDTGGLDLKSAAGMRFMKKDMGGAAHALALARLIMLNKLPVRLRLIIPAVENSIGARSYHPGDIIKTRGGFSVEIHNTDAEGRLILCDAIAEAVSEKPDYLIDFATLTGAARVALGPELGAMFCNNENFSTAILNSSNKVLDPIWRLPLYKPYRDFFKSEIADMANASNSGYAGAITAALFLQTFVSDDIPWMHFDINAFNDEAKPGRPMGGEAQTLRAVFDFLQTRYSS